MTRSRPSAGKRLRSVCSRKSALTALVVFGMGAAISGAMLHGAQAAPTDDQVRACSSVGTPFENAKRLVEAQTIFEEAMTAIVDERWYLLTDPLAWPCFSTAGTTPQPSMPQLTALANSLPGWTYVNGTTRQLKPVRWENFTSITSELKRAYECKLTEIEYQATAQVMSNYDADGAPEFCCMVTGAGCRTVATAGDNGSLCDPGSYRGTDPVCAEVCDVDLSAGDLSARIDMLKTSMTEERARARVAVERTVNALRSFEIHLPFTIQTNCLQRAALDLKNEQGMLADAISCMPKIWDSVTSLHDKF